MRSLLSQSAALAVFLAGCLNSARGNESIHVLQAAASSSGFSFTCEGKSSRSLVPSWKTVRNRSALLGGRSKEEVRYLHPAGTLEITQEIVHFPGLPAIEVMLRIRNTGSSDSPLLENIRPLDIAFDAPGGAPVVFHHALGSAPRDGYKGMARDYEHRARELASGQPVEIVHYVLRGSEHVESYLPFFNLAWDDGGIIGAVGWTGQWWIHAGQSEGRRVALQAGQELTRLKLHPGESIRTPRILLLQWRGGDALVGHNLLRKILVNYYLPRIHGEVQFPPVCHTGAYRLIFDAIAEKTGKNPLEILPTLNVRDLGTRFPGTNAGLNWVTPERSLMLISRMPPVGIEAYWWDAGWFEGRWPNRGTWTPRKEFPQSLKAVGDAAHAKGMKFLLWYDPEGVAPRSAIATEYPQWVLHHPKEGEWGGIFKWSDPRAFRYMTDLIGGQIRDWGIDIYRNDRNTCPLPFWRAADSDDRQGITEVRQIEAFYAFHDALRDRFPNLMIDNANWRITGPDLEMMSRTVGSLTRTELAGPGLPYPVPEQSQTAELSLWVPLHATLLHSMDIYSFRSTATTGVAIGLDLQSPYIPGDVLQKGIAEVKALRPFWLGDYYPLTTTDRDERSWCAWQFDRPDLEEGFAMFFRRSQAKESISTGLRGLRARANYRVSFAETYDEKETRVMTGAELAKMPLRISAAPGSMLVRYRAVKP